MEQHGIYQIELNPTGAAIWLKNVPVETAENMQAARDRCDTLVLEALKIGQTVWSVYNDTVPMTVERITEGQVFVVGWPHGYFPHELIFELEP